MSRPPSWMLRHLGDETRAFHAAADTDRLALMDVGSVAAYRTFLARVYGFETTVEAAVTGACSIVPHALGSWARVGKLHEDLAALGMSACDIAALPRIVARPVSTPAQALGWLFVVERNALLSGLIARYLAGRFPETIQTAARYLDAYGQTAGARLRVLGDVMADHVRRDLATPETIVAAAARAFHAQRQWYGRAGARRSTPVRVPSTRDAA